MGMSTPQISVSIVSHGQGSLVHALLHDLEHVHTSIALDVLLTLNIDETLPFTITDFKFPIRLLRNPLPLGFGANHNQAFGHAQGNFYCVLNPDVRLPQDPFPVLLHALQDTNVALAAPLVTNAAGCVEDSARCFPSPAQIIARALGRSNASNYTLDRTTLQPDWVGGMFMLFPAPVFHAIKGFDTRFFLYYEDVDLCARLRLSGKKIILRTDTRIVHEAQRDSHRKFQHFRWHVTSMLRFFCSPVYRQLRRRP
jgi:N-acetylglucosaminyl-diphospho-decaprenol L-rhamnosyltransferase